MNEKLKMIKKGYKNHVLTTKELYKSGLSKYEIHKLIESKELTRVSKGVYLFNTMVKDDFYLFQMKSKTMIYSNETALFLHNLTGRFPRKLTVTTISGYHLRNNEIDVYYVKKELFTLGLIKMLSPLGNEIYVYDKERTICDIIKNKSKIELQVYLEGIQNYFIYGKVDFHKLSFYAKELGVQAKVYEISSLFMKP